MNIIESNIVNFTLTDVFLNSVLNTTGVSCVNDDIIDVYNYTIYFKLDNFYGTIEKKTQSSKTFYEVTYKSDVIFIITEDEYEVIRPIVLNDYSDYFNHYNKLKYIKNHKRLRPYTMDLVEKAMQHYREIMSNEIVLDKMSASIGLAPCIVRLPEADKLIFKPGDKMKVITYYNN